MRDKVLVLLVALVLCWIPATLAMLRSIPNTVDASGRSSVNSAVNSKRSIFDFLSRNVEESKDMHTLQVTDPSTRRSFKIKYFLRVGTSNKVKIVSGALGMKVTNGTIKYAKHMSAYEKENAFQNGRYPSRPYIDQYGFYPTKDDFSLIFWVYPKDMHPNKINAALEALYHKALELRPAPLIHLYGICFGSGPSLELARKHHSKISEVYIVGGFLSFRDFNDAIADEWSQYNARRFLGDPNVAYSPKVYWFHFENDPVVPLQKIEGDLMRYRVQNDRDIHLTVVPGEGHIPKYGKFVGRVFAWMRRHQSRSLAGEPGPTPEEWKQIETFPEDEPVTESEDGEDDETTEESE